MIPDCIHFFWVGSRMSWMRYMTLASFRRHNPDWRMVLHTMGSLGTERLADLGIEVRPWKPPLPDLLPAHASDLFQWELLGGEGGWYADMDILFLRSMPQVDADAVFCLTTGFMAIGFLGASPGCRLFRAISRKALATYDAVAYQSTGAQAVYYLAALGHGWKRLAAPGRDCLTRFRADYPEVEIVELPEATAYPFTHDRTDRIFCRTESLPPECVGLHWFGGNTLSQEWNGRLTRENWRLAQHRNTFTACAAAMLS